MTHRLRGSCHGSHVAPVALNVLGPEPTTRLNVDEIKAMVVGLRDSRSLDHSRSPPQAAYAELGITVTHDKEGRALWSPGLKQVM